MKKLLLLLAVVSFYSFQGCSSLFTGEPEFIKVNGTQFELDDKPYYFVGTNLWYGCYLGRPGKEGDRARLIRELDLLKEHGITNLRILAGSEDSYIKKSLQPPIQSAPGVYNEELLIGLDFLLSEMRKRDMYAVVFLNNYWEWSGGFAVYNKWFGDGKIVDPDDPKQGWGAFMNYSAEFYRNERANEYFRKYIYKIVTRRNTITGNYYFEDPTIMAWQLANEPRPGRGEESLEYINYFYKWIDETAAFIKSIDPNHLVSTGNEGLAGSIQMEEIFLKAHQSKNIDYATFHLWVKNWSWYDFKRAEETYPSAEMKAVDYINKHIQYARILGKPITLEEFGIGRDNESCLPGSPVTYRDRYFSKIFEVVADSASNGAPIAGTNFWAWGGLGRGKNADNVWRAGDPFVGDPPQEPQGLNSVFDTDASTLSIIKSHADKMNQLRGSKFLYVQKEISARK